MVIRFRRKTIGNCIDMTMNSPESFKANDKGKFELSFGMRFGGRKFGGRKKKKKKMTKPYDFQSGCLIMRHHPHPKQAYLLSLT